MRRYMDYANTSPWEPDELTTWRTGDDCCGETCTGMTECVGCECLPIGDPVRRSAIDPTPPTPTDPTPPSAMRGPRQNYERMGNFDGISNDFPWNGTEWTMPDSDNHNFNADSDYMNHPGFLGWTWSSKKRERQRRDREMTKVRGQYPNTGDCAVLTDSLERIDKSIALHTASAGKGGRGAKRVRKRGLSTRKERRPSIASAQAAACEAQEQEKAELTQLLMSPQIQEARTGASGGGMNKNLAMGLGVLILGGVGYGIYKLIKR